MPVKPAVLSDPVVGNVGLLGAGALVLLHFNEPTGVQPSDATGNLQDLAPDAGTNAPLLVSGWSSSARRFLQASSNALLTADAAGKTPTVLVRDVTIQAIVSVTLAGAAGAQTIIQRGVHDGTAGEAICFGLELQEQGGNPGWIDVRWFWEDAAGVIHTEAAGTYLHPGDGQFVLLTATRRWEALNKVVSRYYVADQLLAEIASADGDIAGATTGHTAIGARKSGGAWSRFLNGTIDELKVLAYEMSLEEVRETWRRLATHQPNGVEMFAGLTPPGSWWAKDPGNRIGRRVKLVGEGLGQAIAKIEELRAMWLPDSASLATINRWEQILGLSPRPLDTLDVRRARVVAFFSQLRGFSIPALQQAFSTVFSLAAADVQILEFTNQISDDFATLKAERWLVGDAGVWTIAAGELKVTAAINADLRWDPSRAWCHVRTPLAQSGMPFIAQVKLSTYWAALPANTIVGLYLYNRRTNNSIWFGVKTVGGVRKVGYQIFANNVMGAFVTLLTPSLDQAYWLRVMPKQGAGGDASTMSFGYSTASATAGFVSADVTTGVFDVEWMGVAAQCDDAAMAAGLQATFDDAYLSNLKGNRPFAWFAYRDPALAGVADMPGAELLALKIRPAHTYAGVCNSKSVLCDDPRDGLCDRGPMGGL